MDTYRLNAFPCWTIQLLIWKKPSIKYLSVFIHLSTALPDAKAIAAYCFFQFHPARCCQYIKHIDPYYGLKKWCLKIGLHVSVERLLPSWRYYQWLFLLLLPAFQNSIFSAGSFSLHRQNWNMLHKMIHTAAALFRQYFL